MKSKELGASFFYSKRCSSLLTGGNETCMPFLTKYMADYRSKSLENVRSHSRSLFQYPVQDHAKLISRCYQVPVGCNVWPRFRHFFRNCTVGDRVYSRGERHKHMAHSDISAAVHGYESLLKPLILGRWLTRTVGMCLLDTIDGALMMALYTSTAFAKDQIAILYYSIVLTVITITVAMVIGLVQMLTLVRTIPHPTSILRLEAFPGSVCSSVLSNGSESLHEQQF